MPATVRLFVALLLGVFLMGISPSTSAQSVTPQCFTNGGNVYPGCTPAKMVFGIYGEPERRFDSLQSAVAALIRKVQPTCVNNGFTCAGIYHGDFYSVGPATGGKCYNLYYDPYPPSFYRSASGSVNLYYYFNLMGPKNTTCIDEASGETQQVSTVGILPGYSVEAKAYCPANHTLLLESHSQTSGSYGFFCAPQQNNTIASSAFRSTCQDGPQQTCGEAGNPIDISDAARKIDRALDMVVAGDFPIAWERVYRASNSSTEFSDWSFIHLKNANIHEITPGQSLARITRGDGSQLIFKSTGTPGTRSWAVSWGSLSSSSTIKTIRSTLSDWMEGSILKGVILKNDRGEKEFYDNLGKLVAVENHAGYRHVYHYGPTGLLTKIEQEGGRFLSIEYHTFPSFVSSGVVSIVPNDSDFADQTAYSPVPVNEISGFSQRNDLFFFPVVKSVSDGDRTVQYAWSSRNQQVTGAISIPILSSVTMASGKQWEYLHENTSYKLFMSGVRDPAGKVVSSYIYQSANGNLSEEWKGPTNTPEASKIDQLKTSSQSITDGLGNYYSFVGSQGRMNSYATPCPVCRGPQAKTFSYDVNQRVNQSTDFNNVQTTYTYDSGGRMSSKTEAFGTPLARTTSYTWMEGYNLPLTLTEPVLVNGVAGQRVTTWTYNAQRQPLTQTVTASNGAGGTSIRTTTYAYNADGRLSQVTDHQGRTTTIYYNGYGDVVARVENPGTPAERVMRWGGHQADGLARWSLNHDGMATLAEWDLDGNLLETRQGIVTGAPADLLLGAGTWAPVLPASGVRQTAYQYNTVGLLERMYEPDGTYIQLVYDHVNRLTSTQRFGINDALLSTTELTLDRMSNVTAVTVKDGAGQVVEKSGAVYDAQYRVSKLLNAAGEILWSQSFDAMHNPLSKVDGLQRTSSGQFDALGRSFKQIDAGNNAFNVTYGPQDEVRTATDARGVVTTYAYNGFGEMTQLASPDRGTWAFAYDNAGRLVTTTDPRGVVVTTTYDAVSRPSTRTFSDTGVSASAGFEAGTVVQAFGYDACNHGQGRLCSIVDSSGTTSYVYNAWGDRVGKAWTGKANGPAAGVTLSTGYAFEAATGRLSSITLPSGNTQQITYGVDGNPLALSYAGQLVVANARWTAAGQLAGWAWPQATGWSGTHAQVSFTYDLDGRPVEIQDLDDRSLVWDVGDRLVAVDDANDAAHSQIYGYDALDRLTSADIGIWNGAIGFTYDTVGNRTALMSDDGDAWQYSYGLNHNRLTSQKPVVGGVPGTAFTASYDAMGNLVNDGIGLQLSYDATGRLAQGSKGPQSMTAVYNALGQRMLKASGSTVRVYAVDEAGRPLGVYVVDATQPNGYRVEEEYVHLDGWRPVAVVRPDPAMGMANPKIFPILTDHLGTPRKVLDGNTGEVRWSWDAKQPFGHEMPNETPTAGQAVFTFDLRFPGQRYDEETGLFHNGFRDYHPGLGRYVQSDPLGLEAGWSTYSYAHSSSTNLLDPYGLKVVFEGSPGALEALERSIGILSKSPTFSTAYAALEKSPRTYTISIGDGKHNFFSMTYANNKLSGGRVDWNPFIGAQCIDGSESSPFILLAHEIGHAYDEEVGRVKGLGWKNRNFSLGKAGNKTVNQAIRWAKYHGNERPRLEWSALNFEQKVANEIGQISRSSYFMSWPVRVEWKKDGDQ